MAKSMTDSMHWIDPVCGRRLASAQSSDHVSEYKKKRYYFCSEHCRQRFQQQTEQFRMRELARAGALFSPRGVLRWGRA